MMEFLNHYGELIIFTLLLGMMWMACFILWMLPDDDEEDYYVR